jgi:hypothetical protein
MQAVLGMLIHNVLFALYLVDLGTEHGSVIQSSRAGKNSTTEYRTAPLHRAATGDAPFACLRATPDNAHWRRRGLLTELGEAGWIFGHVRQ